MGLSFGINVSAESLGVPSDSIRDTSQMGQTRGKRVKRTSEMGEETGESSLEVSERETLAESKQPAWPAEFCM